MARLGPSLGAKQTGTSVYELPPGESLCLYHYEYAEEEWLLVLSGRPTLRDPAGTHQLGALGPGPVPDRPEGAHTVRNDGDEPARVMMYSPVVYPAATVYPDSDKYRDLDRQPRRRRDRPPLQCRVLRRRGLGASISSIL